MKSVFFFFVLCTSFIISKATIRTVCNFPTGIAQFDNLQTCIDSCASGDTIYVHGSPQTYPGFTSTNKKLVMIGPGFSPEKQFSQTAKVAGGFVRNTTTAFLSNGTEFHGLVFTNILRFADGFSTSLPVSNILIKRCQFNSTISIGSVGGSYSNYIIESCYLNNSGIDAANGGNNYSNFIVRNNVFRNALNNRCFTSFINVSNFLVDHNIFYTSNFSSLTVFATSSSSCVNFLLTNNIFHEANADNCTSCTFNNNITFNTPNSTPWNAGTNTNAGGNIANQNPAFIDSTNIANGVDNPLLNFALNPGIGTNAGSDGKNIGLLFDTIGSLNWTNSRNVRLPRMTQVNVLNPSLSPNGVLNIQIEAKTSN